MGTINVRRSNPRLRLGRTCLTVLAVLAVEASLTVGSLRVSSAYLNGDSAASRADARVLTLDQVDLERAAALYRVAP